MNYSVSYETKLNNPNIVEFKVTPQNFREAIEQYPKYLFLMAVNVNNIGVLAELSNENSWTIICNNEQVFRRAKSLGFKVCYPFPISEFQTLVAVLGKGYDSFYITGPIAFDLETFTSLLNQYNVVVRAIPVIAQYDDLYLKKEGLTNFWISPKGMKYYQDYIDIISFDLGDAKKERTLFNIYEEDKIWKDDLQKIIMGLGTDLDEQLLNESFFSKRLNCRQICKKGQCHFCQSYALLAQKIKKELTDV